MPSPAVRAAGPDTELDRRTQDRILRAAAAAQSPGTRRAYDSGWRRFENWCTRQGHQSLPAAPAVVAAYLVDAADTVDSDGRHSYAPATLSKWVAAISDRHRRAGADTVPTQHPVVLSTIAGIRREYAAAGDRPRSPRAPLLTEDVLSIVSAAREQVLGWPDAVHERRDTALLLMGFTGAFRRSELVGLTGADVVLHPLDGVHVHIRRSKTDQEGQGRVHALPRAEDPRRCPPCAFARWAQVVAAFDDGGRSAVIALLSGEDCGLVVHVCQSPGQREIRAGRAIFRAIAQNGNLSETAMSGAAVHAAIRRRAARAGFPASAVARLGAHSLRSGFVTQAFRNGADAHAIMRQTAHRTPAMVERYAREEAPLVGNAVTSLGL
ncbi:tyrosine-type recombinase/integrase [Mycolicibacterium fallax]|uniref:Integrase n=1 Tax=Mycolicibacterium fallax TaxID=1793 RepID=A0A1X1R3C2_MYCFA|nr:tyrosine-type recombinase/integrase [Mycolicibacterium fallax]ORU98657.1 integrase [Mycolicibacterium fallax]BBY99871.1 integrase [Mycolicibacterium fallax]